MKIGQVDGLINSLKNSAAGIGTAGSEILQQELVGKVAGAINPAARGILRKIYNPRLEFLYESTSPRTFTYTFTMTPSNPSESRAIDAICKLFKYESHPSLVEGTNGSFLRYPSQMEIEYVSYNQTNQFLNKIATCVCSSVGVDYNTEGAFRSFRPTGGGAPPVTTTLTLGFTEIEMLTRESINRGM